MFVSSLFNSSLFVSSLFFYWVQVCSCLNECFYSSLYLMFVMFHVCFVFKLMFVSCLFNTSLFGSCLFCILF
ncbi:unnamed protein product [Meloidogyne enterolobii]|uniref:Uncharacterized protein n=1 Tax=Meloidogyne enterolobii TaxID=390850 RepID=A0ACB1AL42_MELEN